MPSEIKEDFDPIHSDTQLASMQKHLDEKIEVVSGRLSSEAIAAYAQLICARVALKPLVEAEKKRQQVRSTMPKFSGVGL